MAHIPSRNGHSYYGVAIGDNARDIHLGDKVGVTINMRWHELAVRLAQLIDLPRC